MMVSSQSYYFSCIVTLYLFFLVFVVLHTLAHPTPHYCRHDQRDVLLEFKHEFPISSANDELFGSWNTSSDCCSWHGVLCDGKSGEVISLELFNNVLNSSLKSNTSLFKLQHLKNLFLYNCSLYGEIPSSLGNLTKLEYLNLGHNKFSGNIPNSFANLAELFHLDISHNQFTSENFFSLLPNLTLSSLYLNSNNFQSIFPPDMSGLHNMEFFDVSENSFSGPFPKSLFTIPSLFWVDLGRNQFKGPIEFDNTSSSSGLDKLILSDNYFIGPIPKSISQLVKLTILDLSNNKFEGQVPCCLRRLDMKLKLSQNAFSSFEKSWELASDDSTIQRLMLNSNSFQGPFPHWICKLKSLRILELSNNFFNGSIPLCLRSSTSYLEGLVLRNNSFTGTVLPDIFFNATSLRVFDVSSNQLEGELPKSLTNCKDMLVLNVGSKKIKDEFPSWLGCLPKLNVLLLRSNQFFGSLYHHHVSIGFPSLSVIDVSHNDFTGTLPPFYFSNWLQMTTSRGRDVDASVDDQYIDKVLWNCTFWDKTHCYHSSMEMVNKGVVLEFERIQKDYKAIDFSGNRLCGKIPESIGLLKSLHLLNFSGNAFTSNIPPSVENLTNLETLDLSRNRLSGQIPRGLGSLSSLSYMNFSYNNLEGLVPRGTQFQRQDCSSFMKNPRLYGLEEICGQASVLNPTPQQSEKSPEPEEPVINWLAAGIAYGPGVLCGLVIGHMFASQRHEWWLKTFGRNKARTSAR